MNANSDYEYGKISVITIAKDKLIVIQVDRENVTMENASFSSLIFRIILLVLYYSEINISSNTFGVKDCYLISHI